MNSRVLGIGHHLPPLVERGGVARPIAIEPVGPSTLAVPAAMAAIGQAGLAPTDVDFIVFATMTPDVTFPGSACFFQHQFGCGTVGALDVRAQCAGFIFALTVADRFIRAGTYRRALVIGSEVHSAGLDYTERGIGLARMYGDGAGVVLVGTGDGSVGIRSTALHSDGRRHREFWCEYPASRRHPFRMTVEDFRAGRHFPAVDLEAIRQFGEESLVAVVREALQAATASVDAVDRFILAHLVPGVAERVAAQLGVAGRVTVPAARHGHLSAAALPVALSEEIAAGSLGPGSTVCLAASGAGFAWGAAVVAL